MRQPIKPVAEIGRFVYLSVICGVLLVASLAVGVFTFILKVSLGQKALRLHLSEKQAAALLAEREEAVDSRKKAARHMLDATNFSPWL